MSEEEFMSQLDHLQTYLYRIALALLGNDADANDALQDACLRAYLARAKQRGGAASFRPWIKSILLHVCCDMLKHRQRVITMGAPEEVYGQVRQSEAPPEESLVWDHVADLPTELREIVALRYLFDLTQEQAARALQIPIGTVKSRLNRALRILRAELMTVRRGEDCAL
ncbi:MAG: RNA polymerase sigma factor [Bacillota bacterium]